MKHEYIFDFIYKGKTIQRTVSDADSFLLALIGAGGTVPKRAKLIKATEDGNELSLGFDSRQPKRKKCIIEKITEWAKLQKRSKNTSKK